MALWRRIPVFSIEQLDEELLSAETEELVEQLGSESPGLRVAAACALALRGDARALDVLVDGLSIRGLRYPILEGLFRLSDPRALEPVRRVFKRTLLGPFERTQAAGVLAGLGEVQGREHLLSRLRRRRFTEDRGLAIELVADLRLMEAEPELERIAADPKDLFRGAALKALAILRPSEMRDALARLVENGAEDPDVRADAAEALAGIGGPEAQRALEALAASDAGELGELARTLLASPAES